MMEWQDPQSIINIVIEHETDMVPLMTAWSRALDYNPLYDHYSCCCSRYYCLEVGVQLHKVVMEAVLVAVVVEVSRLTTMVVEGSSAEWAEWANGKVLNSDSAEVEGL